ncbi:hypothetical protein JTE90_024450 [Oedothorax gibbosus]|uniref:Uncharacterized protein n=1 Tax=Oedothorax gibbosus TaxID=931172 RepID=A0AAV6UA99_9ARAC|nr:hypothetical protein JTE90_024450 [Oedothorax gibbosus]
MTLFLIRSRSKLTFSNFQKTSFPANRSFQQTRKKNHVSSKIVPEVTADTSAGSERGKLKSREERMERCRLPLLQKQDEDGEREIGIQSSRSSLDLRFRMRGSAANHGPPSVAMVTPHPHPSSPPFHLPHLLFGVFPLFFLLFL